jgi:hypothetical protein
MDRAQQIRRAIAWKNQAGSKASAEAWRSVGVYERRSIGGALPKPKPSPLIHSSSHTLKSPALGPCGRPSSGMLRLHSQRSARRSTCRQAWFGGDQFLKWFRASAAAGALATVLRKKRWTVRLRKYGAAHTQLWPQAGSRYSLQSSPSPKPTYPNLILYVPSSTVAPVLSRKPLGVSSTSARE